LLSGSRSKSPLKRGGIHLSAYFGYRSAQAAQEPKNNAVAERSRSKSPLKRGGVHLSAYFGYRSAQAAQEPKNNAVAER